MQKVPIHFLWTSTEGSSRGAKGGRPTSFTSHNFSASNARGRGALYVMNSGGAAADVIAAALDRAEVRSFAGLWKGRKELGPSYECGHATVRRNEAGKE